MEERIKLAYELGVKYESEFTGCAQAVIASVFEVVGGGSDDVFKAASGLADGLGLTGEGTCGALLGGSIAISYYFGREKKDFENTKRPFKSYQLVKNLCQAFKQQNRFYNCQDIQRHHVGRHFNFWDMNDVREALKCKLREHCATVVGNTAATAAMIILEAGKI